MNEFKIDNLFQDKLATHEVQPSINTWNKIDSTLQNKRGRNKYWLYAVAASLVLILTSMFIWTSPEKHSAETTLAENNISTPTSQTSTDIKILSEKEIVLPAEQGNLEKQQSELQSLATNPKEVIIDDEEFAQNNIKEYPDVSSNSLNVSFIKLGPNLNHLSAQFSPDFQYIPMENTDLTLPTGETGIKKAFDYAMRVKNGEEKPFNIRKVKEDLFAMAKNIKFNQSKPN